MKSTNLGNYFTFLSTTVAVALLCIAIARADDVWSAVSAGQKAPAFQARSLDGKTINFPSDYKGKVVLLDFWATWCGPCKQEIPNVAATYQKYHDKGFEIISVSLDQPDQEPALRQFVQDHKMTWPQIYDGGYWKAAVAVQYGVEAIPCPILVDGDTGVIIAQGAGAIGDKLPQLVSASLAAKAKR